tara:strand:- start:560 stop:1306 length:747 start_codon:yes stop_codon:yes gene_type:complete
MNNLKKVLYLDPLKLTGPEQMSIDLYMLEKSLLDKNFYMALRFYTWDGDWLSIGKNQKLPEKWLKLYNDKKFKIVRRPSGGKAVLHSKGLTYALIWKYPPRNKKESYLKTTKWLKDGFKRAGVELFLGTESVNSSNNNCFATATLADLVDKDKNKYVGSAQYWKKGHLLQHGEILMEPSHKLWKKVFYTDPPKIKKEIKKKYVIISFLKESFAKIWPNIYWYNYELDEKDMEKIKQLSLENCRKIIDS